MSSGSGAIGVEVDGLHGTGRTIAGRADGGASHAKGLKENLASAHGSVGHPMVKSALSSFVDTDITTPANHLGSQVTGAGNHVSNVASTTRQQDEGAAQTLNQPITEGGGISRSINRQV